MEQTGTKRDGHEQQTGGASSSGLTEAERDDEGWLQFAKRLKTSKEGMEISAMELFNMEYNIQDDMKWEINHVSDMCDPDPEVPFEMDFTNAYCDENTGENLDSNLVKAGEQEEMERFKKMKVYTYVSRREAERDPRGVFVKVKWVRINKGTRIRQKVRFVKSFEVYL